MGIVGERNRPLLYALPDDPILRLHKRKTLRRLILGEMLLSGFVCLFEAFPAIYHKTTSWAPLPNQIGYYVLVGLWIPVGVLIGLSRYRSITTRPRITETALILSGSDKYPLVAVKEIRLSKDRRLLTLEMNPSMLKRPRLIVLSLGGALVPDGDHFVSVLSDAWSAARKHNGVG